MKNSFMNEELYLGSMNNRPSRREYLAAMSAASAIGLAGCSESSSETQPSETATPTANLGGANFTFEYATADQQVTVQFNGGARVLAGELEIRSSSGLQVQWAELGSTVAGPDDPIGSGASAILGAEIINWEQTVVPTETIRLVHVGGKTPATLGRFTPTEPSTLTSTVPSTPTSEPTEIPTEEPTETPTEEPTEEPTEDPTPEPTATPPADTTAPSITAFSLSNPSGQELRTSFESDEDLDSIEVSISGAEATTLTTADFSESVSGGTYTYEATYQASSDGDYNATLSEAADANDNDGASEQSVSVSVASSGSTVIDDFESGSLDSAWTASTHSNNAPSEPRDTFEVQSDTVGEGDYALKGDSGQSSGGTSQLTREDFRINSDGASLSMYVRLGPILTGYEQANHIEIYAPPEDEENVRILRLGQKDDGRDENDGQIITGETSSLAYVEFRDIQFSDNSVSEVRIDGEIFDENIQFAENADEITKIQIDQGHFNNSTDIILDEIEFEDE